ncbi:MAG: hypothetical protein SX243_03410 [Acidobacteriota bacterium]|nr:hypothetical protein [Acidobacteriota bacterium]
MKIELHIQRLVLEGFEPHERRAVAAALQEELTRRLAEGGLPKGLAAAVEAAGAEGSQSSPERLIPRLDAGSVTLAPKAAPEATGRAVAGQVLRRMGS